MGWTVRFSWLDRPMREWHDYNRHFDVESSEEAAMVAGCEIGRASTEPVVLIDSLQVIPDSLPRSAWPDDPLTPMLPSQK